MGLAIASTLNKSQKKILKATTEYLLKNIGKGAEGYPGQLTADIPQLFTDAYERFSKAWGGDLGDVSQTAVRNLISGKPAYEFDPVAKTSQWRETYAGPVMAAYEDFALPMIKESWNLPGVAYSRARGEGVAREVGGFYGQYVAPKLFDALQTGEAMGFQSRELAAGRQIQALDLPGRQFAQTAGVAGSLEERLNRKYMADYSEWLRTRGEPGWAIQTAMGYMTQPTRTAFYETGGESADAFDYASLGLAGLEYLKK
jgi:hypothetical protein